MSPPSDDLAEYSVASSSPSRLLWCGVISGGLWHEQGDPSAAGGGGLHVARGLHYGEDDLTGAAKQTSQRARGTHLHYSARGLELFGPDRRGQNQWPGRGRSGERVIPVRRSAAGSLYDQRRDAPRLHEYRAG